MDYFSQKVPTDKSRLPQDSGGQDQRRGGFRALSLCQLRVRGYKLPTDHVWHPHLEELGVPSSTMRTHNTKGKELQRKILSLTERDLYLDPCQRTRLSEGCSQSISHSPSGRKISSISLLLQVPQYVSHT